MKRFLLVVLGLLVVGVGAAVYFGLKTGKELTPVADAILRRIDQGQLDEIYRDAAPRFREQTELATMRRYADLWHGALGGYVGVSKTTGSGISTGTNQPTLGKLTLDVEYEHGVAPAEFQFEKIEGVWRLLHLNIEVPDDLLPKADPTQLEPLGMELLDLFARGQLVALYDRFSPELKTAWPAEAFQAQMGELREKLGTPGQPVFHGTEAVEGGHVAARFDVPFERGTGTARLKFFWRDLHWDLLGFKIGAN